MRGNCGLARTALLTKQGYSFHGTTALNGKLVYWTNGILIA
jgi:hypothetical protein